MTITLAPVVGMITAVVAYNAAVALGAPGPGWIAGGLGITVAIGYIFSGLPSTNRQL
jgi:hypothetical protein